MGATLTCTAGAGPALPHVSEHSLLSHLVSEHSLYAALHKLVGTHFAMHKLVGTHFTMQINAAHFMLHCTMLGAWRAGRPDRRSAGRPAGRQAGQPIGHMCTIDTLFKSAPARTHYATAIYDP